MRTAAKSTFEDEAGRERPRVQCGGHAAEKELRRPVREVPGIVVVPKNAVIPDGTLI